MKRWIFFDLDGTLIDSRAGILHAAAHALALQNRSLPPKPERFIGPPLYDSFRQFCGMNDAEAKEAVSQYRTFFRAGAMHENTLYEGIPEALAALRSRGFRLLVVTSKPQLFAAEILERHDLSPLFEEIIGPSLTERGEKADLILQALNTHAIPPESAIMVGDRHFDICGAKAAGIASAGVLYGFGSREELTAAGADLLIEAPAQLPQRL